MWSQVLECAKQLIKGHASLRHTNSPSMSCAPVRLMTDTHMGTSGYRRSGDGVEELTRGAKEVMWKGRHLYSVQRLV